MQHRVIILILALAMSTASVMAKKSTSTTHGVGGYVSGAYHTQLLPSGSELKMPNGWEAGLGFDYRLNCNQFLLNTGLGLTYRAYGFAVKDGEIRLPNSVDSDGYQFTYIYQLSGRKDQYSRLGVEIPLMLGAEFEHFYFALGARANIFILSRAQTQMQVSAYGDYPQFLDPMTSMPEHQFFDEQTLERKQSVSLSSELAASAEIGFLLTAPQNKRSIRNLHPELRLALFANYGLMQFGGSILAGQAAIQTPEKFSDVEDMFSPIQVNHALSTTLVGDGKLSPLTVGLKLIVTMPYRQRSNYPCHCVNDSPKPML